VLERKGKSPRKRRARADAAATSGTASERLNQCGNLPREQFSSGHKASLGLGVVQASCEEASSAFNQDMLPRNGEPGKCRRASSLATPVIAASEVLAAGSGTSGANVTLS